MELGKEPGNEAREGTWDWGRNLGMRLGKEPGNEAEKKNWNEVSY